MNGWSTFVLWVRSWFSSEPHGALAAMQDLKQEKRQAHPEWTKLTRRLAVLVMSEKDRQRLWRRAHHGTTSARLLSGIVAPTPEEVELLTELIRDLESGR